MEETAQAKKDLQVIGELGLLTDAIGNINNKVVALEGRLQKVMINSPTQEPKDTQKELAFCEIAQKIHDTKCGAQNVHRVLSYIMDNLQL